MKRKIPKGGRAERIAFARGWIRERRADEPGVRLSRGRRRVIVAGLYLLLLATVAALSGGPAGALPSILGVTPVTYLIWLGLPMPSTAWQLLLLLIPLGWLATSLPQSVLAWTLPDPEP
jgi:hypothetical protein